MKRECEQIAKLFVQLLAAELIDFPAIGKPNAPSEKGVYIICDNRGSVWHVGQTPRGKNGLQQRLHNHLRGQSSFTRTCFNGDGAQLRLGFRFRYLVVPIGARALGAEKGQKEGKKGADKGIDGVMVFTDDNSGKAKKVIVSVKGGHNVSVSQIRDPGHVIDRENAAIGVYLTLEKPTKPMIEEAVGKGFYHSDGWKKDYPKIQILTVEDILAGKTVELPPNIDTYKKAAKDGI